MPLISSPPPFQAGDSDFKELLGSIVDTSCWAAAKAEASSKIKKGQGELLKIKGQMDHAQEGLVGLERELEKTRSQEKAWEEQRLRDQVRVYTCKYILNIICVALMALVGSW